MKRSLVLLLLSAAGWMLPVAALAQPSKLDTPVANAEKGGSPPVLTEEYAETTIRMIYGRFAQQARDSGVEMSMSLSGFQTIRPEEFDEHYWVDLVTMPGGWTISAGATTFVDEIGTAEEEELGMKLDPRWWEAEDWLALPGNEAMYELNYAYVLQNGDLLDAQTVLALTTFSVEVELQGRTRTYRAAAEWLESDGDDARIRIQDNVNPEVAMAVTKHLEIMPQHPALDRIPPEPNDPANAVTCAETSLTDTPNQLAFDFTGHSTGRHQSEVDHQFKCTCSSSCLSKCDAQQVYRYCGDSGNLQGFLRCHRPYLGVRTQGSTSAVEGAKCASLMACYFQDCALCQCSGLVINITGGVAGLKSTVTGATFWHHEAAWNMQCADCSPIVEPPGPGEPDIPCHDPVPQLHVGPVIGRTPAGGEALFSNFPLERVEYLRGTHYVMEEWAILEVERNAAGARVSVEVPAASSTAYASHQRQSFVENFTSNGGMTSPAGDGAERSVLLVLHHPNHPHNERWIPTPRAHLPEGSLSGEAPEGRAVVRADFAEDRTLSAFEILYSDRPLTQEEAAFLENNLTLVYANDDRHRVVLYGVVQLGGGTVGLESYMPIPSMCCCPSDWPDCGPQI